MELPKFFQAIDDDIHELEQNFALVAEIGEDTYKDYICFKTQTGRCLQRKGATNIRIIDNDRKFVIVIIPESHCTFLLYFIVVNSSRLLD